VRIIKATLVPTITYGGELWGMSSKRCEKGQRVLNNALRCLITLGDKSTLTSSELLGIEADVAPITAITSAARARAFAKYAPLKSTIALLINSPVSGELAKMSWVVGCRRWIRRYCPTALAPTVPVEPAPVVIFSPSIAAARVRRAVWQRLKDGGNRQTLRRYLEAGYDVTGSYLKEALKYPLDCLGVHWLMRFRVNAVWTARKYAAIQWLPGEFRTRCPFCDNSQHGETLDHILIECPRWAEPRLEIQDLIDEGRRLLDPQVGSSTIASYLLGGRCLRGDQTHIRCDHWVMAGNRPHGEINRAEENGVPGFIQVARFLTAVMPARLAVLATLLQPPRADAVNR
jgi:hypothetical protein